MWGTSGARTIRFEIPPGGDARGRLGAYCGRRGGEGAAVGTSGSAADLGAAGELGTFFHGEDFGFDVSVDSGFVLELAALGGDFPFDISVDLDFAGGDIAYYFGIFTDGDLPFF